jgi:UDP-N-acetylmuramate dehydrogenase
VSALDGIAAALETALPGCVTRDAPSAPLTTYRCGGSLAVLVHIEHEDALTAVSGVLAAEPGVAVLIVGRGSNLLVADAGFGGVALYPTGDLESLVIDESTGHVDAGCAVALPVLARRAAAAGVGGLEFFVGIPGSVGGAVRMNAGGHGADTAHVLDTARVFDLSLGRARAVGAVDLGLGYRCSRLGSREVVTGARFRGRPEARDLCEARIDEVVRWRREHQPGGQNAGSVFVNPEGDAAGRLIEAAGLKNTRVGRAVVSDKHANFIVAEPGASADDVYALIREVRRRVEAHSGVRLETELRLIGFANDFEEAA